MPKYHNKKTTVDDYTFDSKKEAERFKVLRLLLNAKKIKNLTLQPEFTLLEGFNDNQGLRERPIKYIADFQYEEGGAIVVEDTKGMKTRDYIMKRKFFKFQNPHIRFIES